MFDFDEIEEDAQQRGSAAWSDEKKPAGELQPKPSSASPAATTPTKVERPPLPKTLLPEVADPSSPWIGTYRRNPSARIRIFAVLGVGCPAGTYTEWVSEANMETHPGVEVVVLELPGHGKNEGKPLHEWSAAVSAIAAEIARLHFSKHDGVTQRPFALYGFSMGATLLWDVARRLQGPGGEVCTKLYVSSRGGPEMTWVPRVSENLQKLATCSGEELYDVALEECKNLVDAAQVEQYSKVFRVWMKSNPEKVRNFCEGLAADQVLATSTGLVVAETSVPSKVSCPMHFYLSDIDEVWPRRRLERDVWNQPCYERLAGTWENFAPCLSEFTTTTFNSLTHGFMGSPQTPAFKHMMQDLSAVLLRSA